MPAKWRVCGENYHGSANAGWGVNDIVLALLYIAGVDRVFTIVVLQAVALLLAYW